MSKSTTTVGIPMSLCMLACAKAEAAGITVVERAGWMKMIGPNGQRVYVKKGKRNVKVIELSMFGEGLDGTIPHKNGQVQARIDTRRHDALELLEGFLAMLLTLPEVDGSKYVSRVSMLTEDTGSGGKEEMAAEARKAGDSLSPLRSEAPAAPQDDSSSPAPMGLLPGPTEPTAEVSEDEDEEQVDDEEVDAEWEAAKRNI
jgi:hypothetical protein